MGTKYKAEWNEATYEIEEVEGGFKIIAGGTAKERGKVVKSAKAACKLLTGHYTAKAGEPVLDWRSTGGSRPSATAAASRAVGKNGTAPKEKAPAKTKPVGKAKAKKQARAAKVKATTPKASKPSKPKAAAAADDPHGRADGDDDLFGSDD
jgi:cell division septation protein DedD